MRRCGLLLNLTVAAEALRAQPMAIKTVRVPGVNGLRALVGPSPKPQGHPAGPGPRGIPGLPQRDLPRHVPPLAALVRHRAEALQPGRGCS